jgi:hypothetical protein
MKRSPLSVRSRFSVTRSESFGMCQSLGLERLVGETEIDDTSFAGFWTRN